MNGKFTGYVWNGSNLAAETNDSTITNLYTYGADGITTANINGTTNIYLKNVHGDVVGMTDTNGTLQKSYRYDAFGNEQNPDEADQNPFRYCGEYFDKETDNIYLRNRYYSPNIGRFITEDPIRDGLNWYVYASNNAITYTDPHGLFDDLTIMGKGSTKTKDIKTLQNKLNELGYTDNAGKALAVDGSFGPSTEQAVNKYKDANGLWNFGEYRGVVGITTWRALGLPVDNDRIYPIYYTTYLVSPHELERAGYVIGEDFILRDMGIAAITNESADLIKQFEKEQIDEMVSMCVSSINISGFTKHGLAQVMGRDGGKGVSNAAFLDAVNNPTKVIHQQEGKIKYVGKNATVILNDVKKVITAWATNSQGVR